MNDIPTPLPRGEEPQHGLPDFSVPILVPGEGAVGDPEQDGYNVCTHGAYSLDMCRECGREITEIYGV